ncbi:methyltransferase [Streptomyces litmocidini]|uniref:protein-L-isoaspartate O-methyltransferase family protein n=1 Tax=Streptomyces TaxID=1883 RepID=UPI000FA17905|nr:methyltransferase [Streptomyces sp. PanSC19]ROQ23462.1 protein-L-isoaspartate(D-aspartate) O-methyltransferase (PCMT) [Streptomyces sp. PanSC19]
MSLDLHAAATSGLRTAMVDRLVSAGVLTDPLLRDALLHVRREVLLPHAYVRVSGPDADPIEWRLLDGSHPDDRQEWLDLIHSDASILLQRDGEQLDALPRGPVTGGHMTSMSTYSPATVEVLQALRLEPGQRYLELGPGPGVSLALAAAVTGPRLAVGVERDGRMAAFARRNLDRLGLGAVVVEGDALDGHPAGGTFDRIHSGIGVPGVPQAWVEQLAPGGRLLTTLATRTPSWPGRLGVTRTGAGLIEATLRGGPRGYRPMLGHRWLGLIDHRARVVADPGTPRATRLAPPPDDAYGFWLAAAYHVGGVVRDFQAETMTLVAPEEDSWVVAGPGDGTVRVHGPRDVWAELEELHARWERAGRPDAYRVELGDSTGTQHVTSGTGPKALAWTLPPLPAGSLRAPRPGTTSDDEGRFEGEARQLPEQRGEDGGGRVEDTGGAGGTVPSVRRPGGDT